jgi:hypothetical protein
MDPTRRTLLKLAGAGAAATLLSQLDPRAESPSPQGRLRALSPHEAATVEAIGARIWPGSPSDPGAREAGTVQYIDRALAEPLADSLKFYRAALPQLDAASRRQHGCAFVALSDAAQDGLLIALSRGRLRDVESGAQFFQLVRTHTLEGLFADPRYGGNRDLAGWKAVGYPGPFYAIGPRDQQSFEEHALPYRSLADL